MMCRRLGSLHGGPKQVVAIIMVVCVERFRGRGAPEELFDRSRVEVVHGAQVIQAVTRGGDVQQGCHLVVENVLSLHVREVAVSGKHVSNAGQDFDSLIALQESEVGRFMPNEYRLGWRGRVGGEICEVGVQGTERNVKVGMGRSIPDDKDWRVADFSWSKQAQVRQVEGSPDGE